MNDEKSVAAPTAKGMRLAKLSSPWIVWPGAGVLAALLFVGLDYLTTALTHESTDDAFIAAHVVSIAPQVAGRVAAVPVLDNQMVHSNDLLVGIDLNRHLGHDRRRPDLPFPLFVSEYRQYRCARG